MRFVDQSKAPAFMLVTECGLGDLARVLSALEDPRPAQRIEVPREVGAKARRSIERMFELAEDKARL